MHNKVQRKQAIKKFRNYCYQQHRALGICATVALWYADKECIEVFGTVWCKS